MARPRSKQSAISRAYGIPVVASRVAQTRGSAPRPPSDRLSGRAEDPSPDMTHKSDVGGVALDLGWHRQCGQAAAAMLRASASARAAGAARRVDRAADGAAPRRAGTDRGA